MTVPQRLSFSAQLSNCNLATCWHIELRIWAFPTFQSACIHLSNSFSYSMKFFQLKITLGLALGESWLLLAQPQKNTDVYKGLLPWEGFPKQTCINHIPRKQGCKLIDQISTVQQLVCASLWRSLCHGNEHDGIDPNMLSSGHHDCSTKAVFLCTADKLQCWPMLARNGTYWRMLVCSLLHISFIGTIASVVQSSSWYQVLSFVNNLWAGLGQILAVACATTEKRWCPVSTFAYFCWKAFLGKPA